VRRDGHGVPLVRRRGICFLCRQRPLRCGKRDPNILGGVRLPRNFIRGVRWYASRRRRRVGCMAVKWTRSKESMGAISAIEELNDRMVGKL